MMAMAWLYMSFIIVIYCPSLNASGLYDLKDNVTILNGDNVIPTLQNSSSLWLLEYYVEWCGHCQDFAPLYKALAKDVAGWSWVVKIGAIDCGATAPSGDENFLTCHQHPFWVFDYPEFRFHPAHANASSIGEVYEVQHKIEQLRKGIIDFIEKNIATIDWDYDTPKPDLSPAEYQEAVEAVSPDTMPDDVLYVALVFEDGNSMMGKEMILDMSSCSNIMLRRIVADSDDGKILARKFNINETPFVVVSSRNGTVFPIHVALKTRYFYVYQLRRLAGVGVEKANSLILTDDDDSRQTQTLVDYQTVDRNQVYLADIESGMRYMLTMEASAAQVLSGPKLKALKEILKLFANVGRFLPGRVTTRKFMLDLKEWIEPLTSIKTEDWLQRVAMKQPGSFLPSTNKLWIGCQSSVPSLRGYPCSLWTIFHTLSVAAYRAKLDTQILPDAMYGYITNFFGCRECRNNFKTEVKDMPFVPTQNDHEAILWLWRMHNKVNARLFTSSPRNDPAFPKVPFPPEDLCPSCRDYSSSWVEKEVLKFLLHRFSFEHVSTKYLEIESSDAETKVDSLGSNSSNITSVLIDRMVHVKNQSLPKISTGNLSKVADIIVQHSTSNLTLLSEIILPSSDETMTDSTTVIDSQISLETTAKLSIADNSASKLGENCTMRVDQANSSVSLENVAVPNIEKHPNNGGVKENEESEPLSKLILDFDPNLSSLEQTQIDVPGHISHQSYNTPATETTPLSARSQNLHFQIPFPPAVVLDAVIDIASIKNAEKRADLLKEKHAFPEKILSVVKNEDKDDINEILKDAVVIAESSLVKMEDIDQRKKDDEAWRKRLQKAFNHVPQDAFLHKKDSGELQAEKSEKEQEFHPRGLGHNSRRYHHDEAKSRQGMGFSPIDFNLCLFVWLASACTAVLLILTLQAKRGWFRKFKLSKHLL